ncbi:MAG: saccharopine dehydrogenase, partial [Gemmatimonas sp.]
GPVTGLQIAWGDLVTAYRSTGIANIEIYVVPSTVWRTILRACASWRGPLSVPFVQRTLRALIRALPNGPTARARRLGHSVVWGEAADAEGRTATSRLRAPEAYTLTAITAVAAAALVLRGVHRPGFQTPALVFGSDFILGVDGVSREDL